MPSQPSNVPCKVYFLHEDDSNEPNDGMFRVTEKEAEGFKFMFGVIQLASNSRAEDQKPVYKRSRHVHVRTGVETLVGYQLSQRCDGDITMISIFITGKLDPEIEKLSKGDRP